MFGRKKRAQKAPATPDSAWRSLRGEDVSAARSADSGAEETAPLAAAGLRGGSGSSHAAHAEHTPEHKAEPERVGTGRDVGEADGDASADDPGTDKPAAAYNHSEQRPDADHSDKAKNPTDLKKPSWTYAFKNAVREFGSDQCTDLAAALTYYAVLALFPGLLALLSVLGVVGEKERSVSLITDILGRLLTSDTVDQLQPTLEQLASSDAAGVTLVIGLAGALWSASGYVGAFSRAMNRIYEVSEGRPFWKLRPMQLIVTLISIVLVAVAMLILVVSGPVAQAIGDVIGLGDTALLVWGIAKWPVLGLVVVFIVALLYSATPNVKQPKFRWLSVGAFIAIVVWLLGSVAFAFYVANFGSYNKTYGTLAGVVVFLLWLWLTNLALLFGAEVDAELERSRELQAGIAAEETLQLPVRDDRNIKKMQAKQDKAIERGREIREQHAVNRD